MNQINNLLPDLQQLQLQQAGQAGQQGASGLLGPPGLAGLGGPTTKQKLVKQHLVLLLHVHRCSRKDTDARRSGGTVQRVSRLKLVS